MRTKPWHGVLVANALPYDSELEVDFDRYGEHVAWLAASGCDGITPNGSLGADPCGSNSTASTLSGAGRAKPSARRM